MDGIDQLDQEFMIPNLLETRLDPATSVNMSTEPQHEPIRYPRHTFPPTPRSRSGSPRCDKVLLDHRTLPLQTPPQSTAPATFERQLPGTSPRVVSSGTRSEPNAPRMSTGHLIHHSDHAVSMKSAGNALSLIMGPDTSSHDAPSQPNAPEFATTSENTRYPQPSARNAYTNASYSSQTPVQDTQSHLAPSLNRQSTVLTQEEESLIDTAKQYMNVISGPEQQLELERQVATPAARSDYGLMASYFAAGSATQGTTDSSQASARSSYTAKNSAQPNVHANQSVSGQSVTRPNVHASVTQLHQEERHVHRQVTGAPQNTIQRTTRQVPRKNSADQQQTQYQYLSHRPHTLQQSQYQHQYIPQAQSLTPVQRPFVLVQQGVIPNATATTSHPQAWSGGSGSIGTTISGSQVFVTNSLPNPSATPQQLQNFYSSYPTQTISQLPVQATPLRLQNASVYMTSPPDLYERTIHPMEPQNPGHAPVQPLHSISSVNHDITNTSNHPLEQPHSARSDRTAGTERSTVPRSRAEETSSEERSIAKLCGAAWKECGGGIVKEYALLKHYQLGLRDLMRQSSEVFYEGLSQWLLSLPPQTRLKDVFRANLTVQDSQTGQMTSSPYLSTPLTVILEQYRDLDKKIVEYHMRNERALDEYEHELRQRLETGLRGLMDVEAMGLMSEKKAEEGQREQSDSQLSLDASVESRPETLRQGAPMPVEISGNAKILRRIHEIDDTNVFVDSNGKVHVYQKDQQIPDLHQQDSNPLLQTTSLSSGYQPHTTSFPQGPINHIDTSGGMQGLPPWMLERKGNAKGSTDMSSSSKPRQDTRDMARRAGTSRAPDPKNALHSNPEDDDYDAPQASTLKRKSGRVATAEKTFKKTKAAKRRAEEVESDDDFEKPKKIKPSPKQKRKA